MRARGSDLSLQVLLISDNLAVLEQAALSDPAFCLEALQWRCRVVWRRSLQCSPVVRLQSAMDALPRCILAVALALSLVVLYGFRSATLCV